MKHCSFPVYHVRISRVKFFPFLLNRTAELPGIVSVLVNFHLVKFQFGPVGLIAVVAMREMRILCISQERFPHPLHCPLNQPWAFICLPEIPKEPWLDLALRGRNPCLGCSEGPGTRGTPHFGRWDHRRCSPALPMSGHEAQRENVK